MVKRLQSIGKESVLLIAPPHFSNLGIPNNLIVPTHLLQLASYIQSRGFQVQFVDLGAKMGDIEKLDEEATGRILKRLNNLSWDFVGISRYTSFDYLLTLRVARICKK